MASSTNLPPRSPSDEAGAVNAPRHRFATNDPEHRGTGISVVHGLDDLMKVVAVRSAVFLGEEKFDFAQQFDGNDLCATHLLYSVEGEPAACIRIRFFGDFAKMERLAVRKEFRRSRIAFQIVRAAVDLCRAKGFRRLYGHAKQDKLDFWQFFGFKLRDNGAPFDLAGYAVVEMVEEVEPFEDAVRLGGDPLRSIRPEGRWDVPGILEEPAKL